MFKKDLAEKAKKATENDYSTVTESKDNSTESINEEQSNSKPEEMKQLKQSSAQRVSTADEITIWDNLLTIVKKSRKLKLLTTLQKCEKRVLTEESYTLYFQTGYEKDVIENELRFVHDSITEITGKTISVKLEMQKIEKEELEPLSEDIILMQRVFKARIVKQEKIEVKENEY